MRCTAKNCERLAARRGWCKMHYARFLRRGSVDIVLPPGRDAVIQMSRRCAGCETTKPASEFHPRWIEGRRGRRQTLQAYCKRCRAAAKVKYQRRLTRQTIAAYGGTCACCGETAAEFLTIDHVGGGGRAHRLSLGGTGTALYSWLRRMGYPTLGFRCLCMNCNFSLGKRGYCPHAQTMAADGTS